MFTLAVAGEMNRALATSGTADLLAYSSDGLAVFIRACDNFPVDLRTIWPPDHCFY